MPSKGKALALDSNTGRRKQKKTEFFSYLPFEVAAESRQEKKNPESLARKHGSLPVVKVKKKPLSF